MTDTAIRTYLLRLDNGLRPLPKDDRQQILTEIESHISDSCLTTPTSAAQVLDQLGDPDELAQSYVEQYRLADALAGPAHLSLLLIILERASRSAVALLTGIGGALLYVFGLAFAAVAVMKPILPQNVGMWTGPHTFALGIVSNQHADVTEHLGYWIIPLGVIAAILCYIGGSGLMRLGGRQLLRQSADRTRR